MPSSTHTRTTDSLGNPVTLQDTASAAALNDFVEGFIACEARAVNVLNAAADTSPIVQASCAALHMFAESADAPRNARPFINQALANAPQASDREQRFVAAVAAWVDGDLPRAIALHEEQARLFPRDLASLKLGQYHLFNRGDSPGMLRLALQAVPAAADVPYLHGMLAFGWEQCHLLDRAEASARHAIALCRKEPWAHHALAHVMLTQGRIREGGDFMASMSDTWTGLNSFMVTHNWWHQALFLLEQDRHAEVLALYDSQVWGVVKEYTQDQIGAVSLLARLELAGVDVGDRWTDVADHLALRLADHVLPFLDLQYLYGLARAGRMEAARTLQSNLEAHANTRTEAHERTVWQQVCVPAAHGLLAHAQGDWATAVEKLGVALPRLVEIGGSHAQRDLFHQIWVDALQRNGQWGAVQNVLQPLVNGQPESVRLAKQVRLVNKQLGLPEKYKKPASQINKLRLRLMHQQALQRLSDSELLHNASDDGDQFDSQYLLRLLGMELLLKVVFEKTLHEKAHGHRYDKLFKRLPEDLQDRLIRLAGERIGPSGLTDNAQSLFKEWGQNFVALRYPWERYDGLSEDQYATLEEKWIAEGAPLKKATFRYHPEELFGMLYALQTVADELRES